MQQSHAIFSTTMTFIIYGNVKPAANYIIFFTASLFRLRLLVILGAYSKDNHNDKIIMIKVLIIPMLIMIMKILIMFILAL